jgi:NADH:ubiquinone reductase (H+-translocating)
MSSASSRQPRVLILGAGFAGLSAAQRLKKAPVEVLLADRRNYHLFQPLLYQVATAALSPAEIASPVRKVLRKQRNAMVMMDEAQSIDVANRFVHFENGVDVEYDYLLVAVGATHSYFGKPEWATLAPGLKTVEDATEIRKRFLLAFEQAELESDPEARQRAVTFTIVGGGPTGVELAGAIAEFARFVLPVDFRRIDTMTARVVLVHAGERILESFSEKLSQAALEQLQRLGVEVLLNSRVTEVDDKGVMVGDKRIESSTVFWAAGVQGSPLGATLGVPVDRSGRVPVKSDLTIDGRPEVFVVGDLASVVDPESKQPVPGVAPAALQMGRYVADLIAAETTARAKGSEPPPRKPFVYHDKGSLAVVGRNRAVGRIGSWETAGFLAWLIWALVHVLSLVTFRNRVMVAWQWMWSYLSFDRGARLITGVGDVKLTRPWAPARWSSPSPPESAPA